MTLKRALSADDVTYSYKVMDAAVPAKANTLPTISDEIYHAMVKSLVISGSPERKKGTIFAFPLFPILQISTTNDLGGDETSVRSAPVQDLRIVFDGMLYSHAQAKGVWTNMMFELATQRTTLDEHAIAKINNGSAQEIFDVRGEGIWTIAAKNLRGDYESDKAIPSSYNVKAGTSRLVMPVTQDTGILAAWGQFDIRAGGALAIRPEDVVSGKDGDPSLIDALKDIEMGAKTIEEALFTKDGKGNKVARFDIYGMDPGFRELNYVKTELDADVAGALSHARRLFGRKTDNAPRRTPK